MQQVLSSFPFRPLTVVMHSSCGSELSYFHLLSSLPPVLCSDFTSFVSKLQISFHLRSGVYKVEYSPPPVEEGNKIKRFGDGEENQKFEKKKKENF